MKFIRIDWFIYIFICFFQTAYLQQNVDNCVDTNKLCFFWANKKECIKNPQWMLINCPRSCKACANPSFIQNEINFLQQQDHQPVLHIKKNRFEVERNICDGHIQTVEIATRTIPNGMEFRNSAFRMGCALLNQPNICLKNLCYHKRYRTFDGSCNNNQMPMKGSAYSPYVRILPPDYEDGISRMIGNTIPRPNPRDVTHLLLSTRVAIPTIANGMFMLFGQFFSHDITRITLISTCNCNTNEPQCANIPISRHDTRQGQCLPFTRTVPLCGTGSTSKAPRTSVNENTAFVDGSQIYGSDPNTAKELRFGPFIRTSEEHRFVFPPRAGNNNILVGDSRANLFIGLAAMHTIFVRLHNKIASIFSRINRHWDEERIYQETRKIVGSIVQVITYQEFFPILLGVNASDFLPPYTGYKSHVEPAIAVEFAGCAFRLHGLIREFYRLVDKNFQTITDIRFVDGTGKIQQLLDFGTDNLIRGMLTVASKKPQRLTTQVTEDLFGTADMGSLNIQRGRDLGIMNYNEYRKFCGMPPLDSFHNWPEVSNIDVRKRVADLYGNNPNLLDLYVGGLLEETRNNAIVGPTFSCIFREQMSRLRDGDRFFYLNQQQFTTAQIESFKRVTLARIICDTGEKFGSVPRNAFFVENGSTAVPCSEIPLFDLRPWKE